MIVDEVSNARLGQALDALVYSMMRPTPDPPGTETAPGYFGVEVVRGAMAKVSAAPYRPPTPGLVLGPVEAARCARHQAALEVAMLPPKEHIAVVTPCP